MRLKNWYFFLAAIILLLFFLFKGDFVFLKLFKNASLNLYRISFILKNYSSKQNSTNTDNLTKDAEIKLLETQNQTLRDYLSFQKKSIKQMVLANVFAKRNEVNNEYFVIDSGRDQGVKEGMAVVEQNGFLVGKIIKSEKNFSYFSPILNSNLNLKINFLPSSGENKILNSGILSNQQTSVLEVNYVLSSQKIQKGDKIIAAENGEYFSRNILIGEVQLVENEPHQLFQKIIVKPYADFDSLVIVGVMFPILK